MRVEAYNHTPLHVSRFTWYYIARYSTTETQLSHPTEGAGGTDGPANGAPAPQPIATIRRNYRLGVINGVLFTLGDSLCSAGLVLALLVRQLGGSLVLVGLLPALQSG